MIIEELDISSDIEELEEDIFNSEKLHLQEADIFYSYPYFSTEQYDYQFRLFFLEDSILLEELKSDENNLNALDNIKVLKEYPKIPLKEGFEMIVNKQDIRQREPKIKIETKSETINYTINKEELESILENNRKLVLLELYDSILQ